MSKIESARNSANPDRFGEITGRELEVPREGESRRQARNKHERRMKTREKMQRRMAR